MPMSLTSVPRRRRRWGGEEASKHKEPQYKTMDQRGKG